MSSALFDPTEGALIADFPLYVRVRSTLVRTSIKAEQNPPPDCQWRSSIILSVLLNPSLGLGKYGRMTQHPWES